MNVWVGNAWAIDGQTKSTVRALALEAQEDYGEGRYSEASQKYERALSVLAVPTLCVFLARTYVKLGKLVQAAELYRRATRLARTDDWVGDGQERAQRDASVELERLLPKLARLHVHLEGAVGKVQLSINGVTVPDSLIDTEQIVDPGTCSVVITGNGQRKVLQITLREGEARDLVIDLAGANETGNSALTTATRGAVGATSKPKKASERGVAQTMSAQRLFGWTASAIGVVGITAGAGAGALVAMRAHQYNCEQGCSVEQASDSELASYNRWRTISTVGFVTGGVFAAAGIALLLTSPHSSDTPTVSFAVTPGMAAVRGSF